MSEKVLDINEKQKDFILNENMWKVMWQQSWPAIIAMVLYGLNSMLDVFFVGRYVGESAVAAVSITYPLSSLSVAFGSFVGAGAAAILSIALGAKDLDTQEKLLGNANVLNIICTLIFMAIGFIFSKPLISMMGGSGEVLALGNEYFIITLYGAIFWVMGLSFNLIIRAEGKMKTAAWMMGTGLAVNALCNYIFMGRMGMGVDGAAWGTNIGMLVYTIVGVIYFAMNKASFKTKVFSLRIDKGIFSDMIKIGIPSFLMSVMSLLQSVVIFNALNKYGTVGDVAFYGIVSRLFNFLLTPIMGLMRALQPVIGINFGAGKYERVIGFFKTFALFATILTVPFWLITMIAPELLMGMMLTEQTITFSQSLALRTYMSILPLLSIVFMGMTFFPAIKKPKPAGVMGMARQFVFYIPVMLIVPRFFGVESIYYTSFAIDLIITIWCAILVKAEFKKLRSIGNEA